MSLVAGGHVIGHRHVVDAAGGTVRADEPHIVVRIAHEGAGAGAFQGEGVHVHDGAAALVQVLGAAETLDHDALGLGVLFLLDLGDGQGLGRHDDLLGDQVAADGPDLEAVRELDGRPFLVRDHAVLHHDGERKVADDGALLEQVVPAGLGQLVEHVQVRVGLLAVLDAQNLAEVAVEVDPVRLGRTVAVGVRGLEFLGLDAGRDLGDPGIVGLGGPFGQQLLLVAVHQHGDDLLGFHRGADEDQLVRVRLLDELVDFHHGLGSGHTIGGTGAQAGSHAEVAVDGDLGLLLFGQLGDLLCHFDMLLNVGIDD